MSVRLIYEVDGESVEVFNVENNDSILIGINKRPTLDYVEEKKKYLLFSEEFTFTINYLEPIDLDEVK